MAANARSGSLRRYILVRVAFAPVFLFLLLTLLFILLRVMPGDPIAAALGDRISQAQLEQRREVAGLNDPILVQYGRYLADVAQGDLGQPITDPRSVTQLVADLFPATFELTMVAMIIAVAIGVVFGAIGARQRDGAIDVGSRLFGILIYAAPVFWLGHPGAVAVRQPLGAAAHGRNRISARVTFDDPTGFYLLDAFITRNGEFFVQSLRTPGAAGHHAGIGHQRCVHPHGARQHAADAAQRLRRGRPRARRSPPAVSLFRHAFKNALVPVITIMGLQFALLLGGAILTETTFSWPGLGQGLVEFINKRDYAAAQGIVTFFAVLVVRVSLLIDILTGIVDPRVRY